MDSVDLYACSVLFSPADVVTKEIDSGRWLLIDPETPNWAIVDEVGKELVDLCDGRRPLSQVNKALCHRLGADASLSASNILEFAEALVQNGFLSTAPIVPSELDK